MLLLFVRGCAEGYGEGAHKLYRQVLGSVSRYEELDVALTQRYPDSYYKLFAPLPSQQTE